jgi:hypothetical protein
MAISIVGKAPDAKAARYAAAAYAIFSYTLDDIRPEAAPAASTLARARIDSFAIDQTHVESARGPIDQTIAPSDRSRCIRFPV